MEMAVSASKLLMRAQKLLIPQLPRGQRRRRKTPDEAVQLAVGTVINISRRWAVLRKQNNYILLLLKATLF